MPNKSTKSVTAALSIFATEHQLISNRIWAVLHGQASICVICSPKGNHFAERTWQSLRKLAKSKLVHTRLPDMYMHHALLHVCHVFNGLPLKDLVTSDGVITTPCELFVGSKPKVSRFRVFWCSCIAKKWIISVDDKPEDNERHQRKSLRILTNPERMASLCFLYKADCYFREGNLWWNLCIHSSWDLEIFSWCLALQPETPFIPDPHTCVEHTGDLLSQFQEGNKAWNGQIVTTLPYEEDIVHSDVIPDPSTEDKEVSSEEEDPTTDESVF